MRHLSRKGIVFFFLVDALLVGAAVSVLRSRSDDARSTFNTGRMRITSAAFAQDETIPPAHTCDGRDISPPLSWSDVPDGTKSLALVMDDPDAVTGTWTHWTVWDIAPGAGGFEIGAVPAGAIQGLTSDGTAGWHGPCPPFGSHRYFFKLFALDDRLGLPPTATVADMERAMEGHVLDKAGLVARYERSKQ